MFNKPLVHDAGVIVDGVAEAAPPVDKVLQLQVLVSIEVQGPWVDGGAGEGGSGVPIEVQRGLVQSEDHVELEALSALAPPGPGAGVP